MLREELFDGYSVYCDVIPMGKDYTLAVYGGDTPHVGSVVLSSVLSGVGHKDEAIARLFAEALAKERYCTVACSCGIHVDDITPGQIEAVREACDRLLGRLLKQTRTPKEEQ